MTASPAVPPLVEAYLDDLDRALTTADPRERAETLAAVREHAAESLARYGADDDSARRVLDELGPVDAIAAAATPAGTTTAAPAAPTPDRAPTPAADVWLVVLAVFSLVTVVAPVAAAATVAWATVRLRSGAGNRAMQRLALGLGAVALVGSTALYVSHVLAG
ncbi:HAAS signaling domain-containing protein [Krasilnikoviella flava]|uniref:Uncharacterized protein n=1 Tax=Krasilnikoviella flava TaxID=526729 RepID=A0A1T5J2N1_9MICO|nr:hypothetical protein [Krasilnikoviella flava]SKC45591.1 hypothetical protein SAMN04324258_0966 [Krasilnikoviella flava]